MAVVDVMHKLDVPLYGLSFSQAVKIALASSLEAFRQNGTIPRREGFEYSNMMEPFLQDRNKLRAEKLRVATNLSTEREGTHIPPLVPESPEHRRGRIRFEELRFKATTDSINMSPDELNEYIALQQTYA